MEEILNELKAINSRLNDLESRNKPPRDNNHNNSSRFFTNQTYRARESGGGGQYAWTHHGGRPRGRYHATTATNTRPPTSHRGPTDPQMTTRQQEPPHREGGELTSPEFLIFKNVQLRYHTGLWSNLPRSIEKNLDNVFDHVTPPLPDQDLRDRLKYINDTTKAQLLAVVQQHLKKKKQEAKTKLNRLEKRDVDNALDAARTRIRKRFGRKLDGRQVDRLLTEEREDVRDETEVVEGGAGPPGSQHEIPVMIGVQAGAWSAAARGSKRVASESFSDLPTHNRFTPLEENEPAALSAEGEWPPISPPRPQHKRPARQATPTPQGQGSSLEDGGKQERREATGGQIILTLGTEEEVVMEEGGDGETTNIGPEREAGSELPPKTPNPSLTITPLLPTLAQQPTSSDPRTLRPEPRPSSSQPALIRRADGPPVGPRMDRLTIHDSKAKSMWSIGTLLPTTDTLIIADSQFRLAREIPADWEIHVFPGANLCHASGIAQKLPPKKIPNIVAHVGINNRGCAWENSAHTDLGKFLSNLAKATPNPAFCGIAIPEGFPPKEKTLLRQINDHARIRSKCQYVEPVPTDQVSVSPDGLHYKQETVDKILDNIKLFLSKTPRNRRGSM